MSSIKGLVGLLVVGFLALSIAAEPAQAESCRQKFLKIAVKEDKEAAEYEKEIKNLEQHAIKDEEEVKNLEKKIKGFTDDSAIKAVNVAIQFYIKCAAEDRGPSTANAVKLANDYRKMAQHSREYAQKECKD